MISVAQLAQAQSLSTKSGISSVKEALGDTSSDSRTIKIEQKGRKEPLEIKLSETKRRWKGSVMPLTTPTAVFPPASLKLKKMIISWY